MSALGHNLLATLSATANTIVGVWISASVSTVLSLPLVRGLLNRYEDMGRKEPQDCRGSLATRVNYTAFWVCARSFQLCPHPPRCQALGLRGECQSDSIRMFNRACHVPQ